MRYATNRIVKEDRMRRGNARPSLWSRLHALSFASTYSLIGLGERCPLEGFADPEECCGEPDECRALAEQLACEHEWIYDAGRFFQRCRTCNKLERVTE